MRVCTSKEICFVTAATEGFVPGALATLCSFRQQHPDFAGDLVLVHDALPEAHRQHLAQACPGVRFEPVSRALRERLAALVAARPAFAPRLGQFYSLEAFRLRGYRKVLYYDSDVLFQAPVADLFDSPAALLCCGDEAFLSGRRRDAATFARLPPGQPAASATEEAPGVAGALERTFGAGFLLVDAALVEEGCYADLLALVSPDTWRGTATTHTDQLVLNLHFAGRQTLASWRYDFVLPLAEAIRQREGVDAASARALHFAGPVKPWMPAAMLGWTRGDAERKPIRLFRQWYDAYVGYLAAAHVRGAGARRRGEQA